MNPPASKLKFRSMTFPRKRAITACENCRARKRKCDNVRPVCSTCIKDGLPCSYDLRLDHSSFDPASLLIIEKLNETLRKLDNIGNNIGSSSIQQSREQSNASPKPRNTSDLINESVSKSTSHDFLEVSTSFASVDSILTWPIFAQRWPRDYLANELFAANVQSIQDKDETPSSQHDKYAIDEEHVPELIDKFLNLVHCKNPIFHSRDLRKDAKRFAEHGVGWDASSCLVLLACALGAIASPFNSSDESGQLHGRRSDHDAADRIKRAEAYYQSACKRIGLLNGSLIACQCHMLSGIYLMYTLKPLQGWSAFHTAGSTLSLYLKGQAKLRDQDDTSPSYHQPSQRHLEQRLYWTCLKSECEVRLELDLPQSGLCNVGYPHLFPSPPVPSSPAWVVQEYHLTPSSVSGASSSPNTRLSVPTSSTSKLEEQSWFYYLSEIALRRLENRVLDIFYKQDHDSWSRMDLHAATSAVEDIESQLVTWYSSLPSPIRFENLRPEEASDELRLMTRGRSMNIRFLLYRPFLYRAIHFSHQMDTETKALVDVQVQKVLDVCVEYNSGEALSHRHHGTWYGLRGGFEGALMLYAAQQSGIITWEFSIPGHDSPQENRYGRAIRICLEKSQYWQAENTDVARCREILLSLLNFPS